MTFSGGEQQRVNIARGFAAHFPVLLLDEPTAGLDMTMRKSITAYVHQLAEEAGLSVLWTTHLADEIDPKDDVLILHRGKLAAQGTCEELTGSVTLSELFQRLTSEAEAA